MAGELISKFRERPKTKTAWRAMYLGLSVLLVPPFLGIFAAIIRPAVDKVSNESVGVVIGFMAATIALGLSISALVASIHALRLGERSWVLWIGFVPAVLIGAFWIFMIIGEFVFPH